MQLSKTYISYYGLMFLILISWLNPFATPPELWRILYLLALLGPLTIKQPKLLAIIIPAFYSISNYICFISYMPTQVFIYLVFPIAALFLHKGGKTDKNSIIFLVFFIITAANNFINNMTFESISSCCLLAFLWFKFVPNSVNSYAHTFSYAFTIMSLTLSIFFIVGGSAFQMDFGTGVVKITPAHDPNDFEVGLRHNLEVIKVIDEEGKMNELAGKFAGMDRLDARKAVVEELKKLGNLVRIEDYTHNVGHCDRCKTVIEPLIYSRWLVNMDELA